MIFQLRMEFPERTQREAHNVVIGILAASEGILQLAHHSDYMEQLAFNIDLFPDGGFRTEKLFGSICAQNDHLRATLIFTFVEPAPSRDRQIVNLQRIGRITFEDSVFRLAAAILYDEGASSEHRLKEADARAHILHV